MTVKEYVGEVYYRRLEMLFPEWVLTRARLYVQAWYFGWVWWLTGMSGITLGRYCFFQDRPALDLVAHELVHVRQYRRYGVLGFLVRYVWQWIQYGGHHDAMPLEQEAIAMQRRV